mmetsp:Transcript_34529/g.55097  ORF Transcript_34529/g.55097 Transcript_34529/m.55097 type:complete len:149 (-) Transcript_34529:1410-1856(-)
MRLCILPKVNASVRQIMMPASMCLDPTVLNSFSLLCAPPQSMQRQHESVSKSQQEFPQSDVQTPNLSSDSDVHLGSNDTEESSMIQVPDSVQWVSSRNLQHLLVIVISLLFFVTNHFEDFRIVRIRQLSNYMLEHSSFVSPLLWHIEW